MWKKNQFDGLNMRWVRKCMSIRENSCARKHIQTIKWTLGTAIHWVWRWRRRRRQWQRQRQRQRTTTAARTIFNNKTDKICIKTNLWSNLLSDKTGSSFTCIFQLPFVYALEQYTGNRQRCKCQLAFKYFIDSALQLPTVDLWIYVVFIPWTEQCQIIRC